MSYLCTAIEKSSTRPDGGIGRRAGLKHQWIHFHPGSTPGLGTEAEKVGKLSPLFFYTPRNSLVCWDQRRINEYLHVRRRRWYGKATDQRKNLRDFHFMHII